MKAIQCFVVTDQALDCFSYIGLLISIAITRTLMQYYTCHLPYNSVICAISFASAEVQAPEFIRHSQLHPSVEGWFIFASLPNSSQS